MLSKMLCIGFLFVAFPSFFRMNVVSRSNLPASGWYLNIMSLSGLPEIRLRVQTSKQQSYGSLRFLLQK
jgi:hypothetical protein